MADSLLHELVSDSELSNLSPELQNKLEGILIGLQCKIDSLKAQHEQFRVDSGKIVFIFPLCVARVWETLPLADALQYILLFY